MADQTAAQQLDGAMKQIMAAKSGVPLANIGAEHHPSVMLQPPMNNTGARLRVAYWLAVAARPVARGQATQWSLLSHAEREAGTARAEGTGRLTLATLVGTATNPFATDNGKVGAILYAGEQAAARAGRADVTSILNGLRNAASAGGALDLVDPRDPSTYLRAGLAAVSVTPFIVGAVALFLVWPYLPAASTVAKVGGSAYAGYRERRQS